MCVTGILACIKYSFTVKNSVCEPSTNADKASNVLTTTSSGQPNRGSDPPISMSER